jgi:hypothetical protein
VKIILSLILLGMSSFAVASESSLELDVTHYSKNGAATEHVVITKENVSKLEAKFNDEIIIGYMSDMEKGKACFHGVPQEVATDIISNSNVIEYYGDEECGKNGVVISADENNISYVCDNEDTTYDVVVPRCK